jgi:hypothetical protein
VTNNDFFEEALARHLPLHKRYAAARELSRAKSLQNNCHKPKFRRKTRVTH